MIVQYLTFTICVFLFHLWYKKQNKGLPPGPIRLPILGSVVQLYRANSRYPHLALAKLSEKYGEIMSLGFGMQTAVVVSSYEIMKEIFKRLETNSHRFEFPFVFDRSYGKNLGIIWSHGQVWSFIRRFAKKTLKQLGYNKSILMDQSLIDSANQLVDCIKMELLESDNGKYFVQSHKFSVHTFNVLWNMLGGYKFQPDDELLKKNLEFGDKIVEIFGHANPYNVIPFLRTWFPKQMRYPEHLQTHKELHVYMKTLINGSKKKRSQRIDSKPTSFIEVFLDKIEMHHGDADTIFTQEQLELVLEDLFLAGSTTTGTVLNWSILFLVQNPDTQLKLRQEILRKVANCTDILQSTELKKIPYLKATVLEILRMGNIAPVPPPRYAMQDVRIKNYLIPKGSLLFYNLYPMYNDKNYWKDPENFRPERYINECGDIDQKQAERIMNSVFGFGARACFGETIAVDTLFIFLATLILNFEFHSIPGQEPSAENPCSGLTVSPREYFVRIVKI